MTDILLNKEQIDDSGAWILRLEGSIDGSSAHEVRFLLDDFLGKIKPQQILLDMSRVSYISSLGLSVLIWLSKQLPEQNSRQAVSLYGCQTSVERVLEISRLNFLKVDRQRAGIFEGYMSQQDAKHINKNLGRSKSHAPRLYE